MKSLFSWPELEAFVLRRKPGARRKFVLALLPSAPLSSIREDRADVLATDARHLLV